MRNLMLLLVAALWLGASPADFYAEQTRTPRVRKALQAHEAELTAALKQRGASPGDLRILFIAYKAEQQLELYIKRGDEKTYRLFSSFPICARAGTLGPKTRQGDGQVPEGVYHIDRFNSYSSFHLSLGLNYPNAEDRVRAGRLNPGGDIFIHGSCVTIGCMPMTDPVMEKIYLLALWSRRNGQQAIPVYSFPFRMTEANLQRYSKAYPQHTAFWKSLKEKQRTLERQISP